jgi:hypothetical protein
MPVSKVTYILWKRPAMYRHVRCKGKAQVVPKIEGKAIPVTGREGL